ncbi:TIGR04282 family arsenosugar biosynthesis glycosyltransferase [Neptunomonas sp.]|uniref:TIGR04282 family arsenosugar biosynthesis glycosyltransferase n=1 Tax=Neptunomonas sp. TaxID=1971898 RepID=UPI0025F85B67|nr:TIGR04282 family arsenosugar biosynthesis glycosyltransferase [Neptunomonas sp.]
MSTALIIFAKAPVAGVAKTRLIPALGAEGAAQLHSRLVEHTVQRAIESACFPIYLFTPEGSVHPFIDYLLATYPLTHKLQEGVDLGERMKNALTDVLANHHEEGAMLVGSDCPAIDTVLLGECGRALESHDAVFLPAEDGGYALVGFKKSNREFDILFSDIEWGTENVMSQTRVKLKQQSVRWSEPACVWDVDRPEDLSRLIKCFPALYQA